MNGMVPVQLVFYNIFGPKIGAKESPVTFWAFVYFSFFDRAFESEKKSAPNLAKYK